MSTIANAKNIPLNQKTGSVPDVGGALLDWFQPMVFTRVVKTISGFQLIETSEPVNFRGVIQPFSDRQLMLKPEGQRSWTWLWLHADPVLTLDTDEVVTYNGVQTRVMARKDYTLYGYVEYQLVQDWTGAGPTPEVQVFDGGGPDTAYENELSGGEPEPEPEDTIDGGVV